ncbi:MAG: IS21 family transposase [Gammaproteobacteria bacterium]
MAKERLSMRKIKEALRLKYTTALPYSDIGRSCVVAPSTISEYLRRANVAGLTSWEKVEPLTEQELEALFFPAGNRFLPVHRAQPDFAHIQRELSRHKHLNLTLDQLWQEYKAQSTDGYQYSQFCEYYRRFRAKQDLVLRQDHKAGEKLFVDYGDGLFLTDPDTGVKTSTEMFVTVWGASNYTYVEATLTQELACWIESHQRAFSYFGCVPHILVPDNLKSGVTKAHRYEPEINRTYADMAEHYATAVVPARSRKPRDKAKVEAGVLIAQRWILSVLRHRTFHTLAELNAAIRELLEKLNTRRLKKRQQSRRQLFEELDKPFAKALPLTPYEFAQWRKATVNIDYHVALENHYYSVPFHHIHEHVDLRLTASTLEVFRKGHRIAAHPRSFTKHRHTTIRDHMPLIHQAHTEWTPSRIVEWAAKTGPSTVAFVETLMKSRQHPEQAYRACLGVLRLTRHYPAPRIEAATARALLYNTISYQSLERILKRDLDKQPEGSSAPASLPSHENIRGGGYYN